MEAVQKAVGHCSVMANASHVFYSLQIGTSSQPSLSGFWRFDDAALVRITPMTSSNVVKFPKIAVCFHYLSELYEWERW